MDSNNLDLSDQFDINPGATDKFFSDMMTHVIMMTPVINDRFTQNDPNSITQTNNVSQGIFDSENGLINSNTFDFYNQKFKKTLSDYNMDKKIFSKFKKYIFEKTNSTLKKEFHFKTKSFRNTFSYQLLKKYANKPVWKFLCQYIDNIYQNNHNIYLKIKECLEEDRSYEGIFSLLNRTLIEFYLEFLETNLESAKRRDVETFISKHLTKNSLPEEVRIHFQRKFEEKYQERSKIVLLTMKL
jgi:hypothetical protein